MLADPDVEQSNEETTSYGGISIDRVHGNVYNFLEGRSDQSGLRSLGQDELSRLTKVPYLDNLVDHIMGSRILFLQYTTTYNANEVAKYLSKRLSKEIQEQDQTIPIFYWHKSGDATALFQAVSQNSEQAIYILPDLAPYDITEITTFFSNDKHFFIVITSHDEDSWDLPTLSKSWQNPSVEELYTPKILAEIFFQQLDRNAATEMNSKLSEWVLPDEDDNIKLLPLRKWLNQNISKLKSPSGIDQFLALSFRVKDPSPDVAQQDSFYKSLQNFLSKKMEECAQQTDQMNFISSYLKDMNGFNQMLLLCATMLEGLRDDQYFELIEALAYVDWGRRNDLIYTADYDSLQELNSFFSFNESIQTQPSLQSHGLRILLLEKLWTRSRRQVLVILKVLIEISKGKHERTALSLLGDDDKRRYFEPTLKDFLRDLSLNHFSDIEAELLEIAISRDYFWRESLAKALAEWHIFGRSNELVKKLERWWEECKHQDGNQLVQSVLKMNSRNRDNYIINVLYLRITTISIVEKVLLLQRPSEVNEDLLDLLIKFSQDFAHRYSSGDEKYANIVNNFFIDLLSRLIIRHFDTMRPRLERLAREKSLRKPMSFSLAVAHQFAPGKVMGILDNWLKRYQREQVSDFEETGIREHMLILITETYGFMKEVQNDR